MDPDRGGIFRNPLCFVLLAVLLVLVERPLEELMDTIETSTTRRPDRACGFAKREDDIGQLGRQFNEMVERLDQNRQEIEELHAEGDGSRGTSGHSRGDWRLGWRMKSAILWRELLELWTSWAKELPANSPSRGVIGEVHREILHIQAILNDLLSYARPRPPDFHRSESEHHHRTGRFDGTATSADKTHRRFCLSPIQLCRRWNMIRP